MRTSMNERYSTAIHPLHAVMLAGSVSLFLSAAMSDAAYAATYEIQWLNFASWLIVGGLFFSGIALLFAIGDLSRPARRAQGVGAYAALLLAAWVLGLFNAFIHARDAWGSMPAGLVLSIIVFVLACTATWFGYATFRVRAVT